MFRNSQKIQQKKNGILTLSSKFWHFSRSFSKINAFIKRASQAQKTLNPVWRCCYAENLQFTENMAAAMWNVETLILTLEGPLTLETRGECFAPQSRFNVFVYPLGVVVFVCFCFLLERICSASLPGRNEVDSFPPVCASTFFSLYFLSFLFLLLWSSCFNLFLWDVKFETLSKTLYSFAVQTDGEP